MITVPVSASKEYNVRIASGLLSQSGEIIREVCGGEKAVIVTDDIVKALYGDIVRGALEKAGYLTSWFVFPNGELSKNIDTYIELLSHLSRENLTRSDVVAALGGGVVGDLAGFAAATYLRGVKFVQIPTTLLAMVDSSVGGKTAVNLQSGKNQVGAFYQPDVVICDDDTLSTLRKEVFGDGVAEMIKHAVIKDAELFELLKKPLKPQIETLIARNVTIKRDVVALDEKDLGIRQILNFGHTTGHGIEKLSDYKTSHGSAVAIGMVIESRGEVRRQIIEMLKRCDLPVKTEFSAERLIEAAFADKKRSGGKITLIIPDKIGECRLERFGIEELGDFIREGLKQN
ncbi:MAG: 3-dehydroquinate synthase [Oscillospiraceae bacterium]|nr:3-dehydroquinate synthase [Oscillospiraceae bacterium]